ncbi:MAG TPA: 3-oxoacyl-ACP reductase family protein [Verrucomicrobiales bacterium]|nr:3-oxoacyl-ACP reductase family protein [Verrucomicrobiales bacterium]
MDHGQLRPLKGKIALVTGGSRGIGAAITTRLAADGAQVIFTYRASSRQAEAVVHAIESAGGKATALKADIADPESARSAVSGTVRSFGKVDILVNNAGVAMVAPIAAVSLSDFERLIAVNVRGLFVSTQEATLHMHRGGRIIHIGSCNSSHVPYAGGALYALTKGAIASFTKALARELGPRGITVNNVQPGPIDTDMNPADSEFAKTARKHIALQRYGHAEEIASLVAYLASDEAAFITGANLAADGGYTA